MMMTFDVIREGFKEKISSKVWGFTKPGRGSPRTKLYFLKNKKIYFYFSIPVKTLLNIGRAVVLESDPKVKRCEKFESRVLAIWKLLICNLIPKEKVMISAFKKM